MTSSVLPSASFSFATRFSLAEVGRRRRHRGDDGRADFGGELHEVGREEVGHDLEVGAARERAPERVLRVGSSCRR